MASAQRAEGIIRRPPRTTNLAALGNIRMANQSNRQPPTTTTTNLDGKSSQSTQLRVPFCPGCTGSTPNPEHILCPFHRTCPRCPGSPGLHPTYRKEKFLCVKYLFKTWDIRDSRDNPHECCISCVPGLLQIWDNPGQDNILGFFPGYCVCVCNKER